MSSLVYNYAVFSTVAFLFYFFIKFALIVSQNRSTDPDMTVAAAQPLFDSASVVHQRRLSSTWKRNCSGSELGLPARVAERCVDSNASCAQLTCENLLSNSRPEIYKTVLDFTQSQGRDWGQSKDADLVNETADCGTFRKVRGFWESPHPDTLDFPLAFNVLVHSNAHQVMRLLRAIYRPNNLYCLHVDAKAADVFRTAMKSFVRCFDNIRFASKQETITWGGYSRLQADITCMRDHIATRKDWKYLINTAGQAFPMRTVEEIVKILRIYNGANDIEGIYGKRVLRSRFVDEWIEIPEKTQVRKTGRKNPDPPHNIDIVRGSAYGIFSRKFVEFVLNDRRARDLLVWGRRTWSPDEFFWATLHHLYANPHLHTPGGYTGDPNTKPFLAVYANWLDDARFPCHGQAVRSICVLGAADLPALLGRKEFFVNKFYEYYQPLALDCFEAWIRHKEVCPPSDTLEYYRQLPYVISGSRLL